MPALTSKLHSLEKQILYSTQRCENMCFNCNERCKKNKYFICTQGCKENK